MNISNVLKAMGHPIRLRTVVRLLQKQMCARSLVHYFEGSEPTISMHLNILKMQD